jgi:uncharacterized membrane protein HdeD (DUF308 family)
LLKKGAKEMSPLHAESVSRHRWSSGIRGGLVILFGLVALFWPIATIIALVLIFASVPLY